MFDGKGEESLVSWFNLEDDGLDERWEGILGAWLFRKPVPLFVLFESVGGS